MIIDGISAWQRIDPTRPSRRVAISLACIAAIASCIPAATQAQVPRNLSAEVETARQIGETISTAEWLGPLAPVALSPFFGITCLSAMAIMSEGTAWETNALLGGNTPFKNPALFWTFLVLTLVTSLPRLTKVSKPVVQVADQLETYAGIVTLLVIRFLTESGPVESGDVEVMQAGFFSVTVDSLLIVAMVVNVLVINSVKFFFEVLIWITPFPLIDAMFEAANKSVCAGLMVIYGMSPTLATAINLAILACCLVVFRWIRRRDVFYRSLFLGPIISWISKSAARPRSAELIVFPRDDFGPFAAKSRCRLMVRDGEWVVQQSRLLRPPLEYSISRGERPPQIHRGLLSNRLEFDVPGCVPCLFSRRYDAHLEELAALLGVEIVEGSLAEPGGSDAFGFTHFFSFIWGSARLVSRNGLLIKKSSIDW